LQRLTGLREIVFSGPQHRSKRQLGVLFYWQMIIRRLSAVSGRLPAATDKQQIAQQQIS
jgi:hypothetical protein